MLESILDRSPSSTQRLLRNVEIGSILLAIGSAGTAVFLKRQEIAETLQPVAEKVKTAVETGTNWYQAKRLS